MSSLYMRMQPCDTNPPIVPGALVPWMQDGISSSRRLQNSSGGKDRLGNISKRGDRYLRSLFTTGALAVIRYAKIHGTGHRPWLTALLARRPTKVAAIALANKIARMAWAMMAKSERYKEPAALAA
jgi:transposase